MFKIFILDIIIIGFNIHSLAFYNANDIIGTWRNEDNDIHVEVYKKGSEFIGKIKWMKDKSKSQSMGKIVLWNLFYDQNNSEWNKGLIQLPEMDHSANCYVKMINKNTIILSGYHGLRIFGKDFKYIREN